MVLPLPPVTPLSWPEQPGDLPRDLPDRNALDQLLASEFPSELNGLFKNIETKGNPWGFPQAERLAWADGLDVPLASDNPGFEVLWWVGCAGSFDRRAQKVTRAIAKLLIKAGVNFAVLGPDECCTGDSARRLGD